MSELLRLIVLIITMGIVIYLLWRITGAQAGCSALHSSPSGSLVIVFCPLLKFLYLADNTKQAAWGQPGYGELFKLWPFMDPLIQSVSGLGGELEEVQISTLVYSMGDKAEDLLQSFKLKDEETKRYQTVKGKFKGYFIKRHNTT